LLADSSRIALIVGIAFSMSERIPKMFWRAQRQGGFSLLFGSLEYFGLRPFAFDYKGA
jgi:hypothetical protein